MDFSWINSPAGWVALLTLTLLEIVLGIDNVIFISILSGKLPLEQRDKARKLGLTLALITRVLLLLGIAWIAKLTTPLFELPLAWAGVGEEQRGISGRDIILIVGGLFLLAKSVHEIHHKLEGHDDPAKAGVAASFASVIAQILVLDVVFSLDSVITAIGMADNVTIMIAAVMIAIGFMLMFAGPISNFVEKHPTVKMLALSFLLLIGMTLVAEGFEQHIPKGYIYFAMAFAVMVEMLNLRLRKPSDAPVKLHEPDSVN